MSVDTTARFFRPADVSRIRRNQRRVQLQRALVVLRSAGLVAAIVLGGVWTWRHTRSGERFAVRQIEVSGAVHTSPADIEAVTSRYEGMNLFQIDIARVQRDLGSLGWVQRIDIEKTLPDTLRIKISERVPVALVRSEGRLAYVDASGAAFADLSPAVGNDELPLVLDASGAELRRAVDLLESLRRDDPQIYARVSEVRPVPPHGFALFDRELGAIVYANGSDAAAKWRRLYSILEAEGRPEIEYADLRFADRVVVRTSEKQQSEAESITPAAGAAEGI